MRKFGLKLWSTNTTAYYNEAKRLFDGGFFHYIELYVLPNTLEQLLKWKDFSIPYIIHCPHSAHGFNLADRRLRSSNRRIYDQVKQYADELHAKYIIFHSGTDGSIEETACQLAGFHESRALIENKPMCPLPDLFHSKECRGFSVEELRIVINDASCGFCLDTGHAICAANALHKAPYQYLITLRDEFSPAMYHLSDLECADAVLDSHFHFGHGALDIKRILSIIPNSSLISIETQKDCPDSLTDFEKDVLFLRRKES